LVEFDGNPTNVTSSDIAFLEKTFRETYNDLIRRTCDVDDRFLVDAFAITQNGSAVIPNGGLSYSIKFSVELTCRGCNKATVTAFSPPLGHHASKDAVATPRSSVDITEVDTANSVSSRPYDLPFRHYDPIHKNGDTVRSITSKRSQSASMAPR
jgi:hypothetical protein